MDTANLAAAALVCVAAPVLAPRRREAKQESSGRPGCGRTSSGSGKTAPRATGSLRSILARLRAALCWRAMQPTLGMLWAEAAGHTSYRATWINVTDGGHYDNLGLVEALRRGARNIVVLDASGDRTDTWFTLGGAIALARADAGVEISLDPTTMIGGHGRCTPPGSATARCCVPGRAAPSPGPRPRRERPAGNGQRPGERPPGRPVPGGEHLDLQARLVGGAPRGTSAPTPRAIRPTPATARCNSSTTAPNSRPITNSGLYSMAAAIASWRLPVLQDH